MKRPRIRFSNRLKCLLCYLLAFSLPLLALWAGLGLIYPYRLAGTAPNVAQNALQWLPGLKTLFPAIDEMASLAAESSSPVPEALRQALARRETIWQLFIAVCGLAGWGMTLLLQLLWRIRFHRTVGAADRTRVAIRHYRLNLLLLLALNGGLAALIWGLGVRFIPGRTLWDYLAYFLPYGLNLLAAFWVFRLAAPPAISGRHGFFKRM